MTARPTLARRLLEQLYRISGALAACFLAIIAVMTLAQIIGRFFGTSIPAATEFAGFAMSASTFLALGYALRRGNLIRVTLLIRNIGGPFRRVIEAWVCLAGTVLAGFSTWWAVVFTVETFEFGDVAPGLIETPLWIPQIGMVVGLAVLTIACLDSFVDVVMTGRRAFASDDNRINTKPMTSSGGGHSADGR